MDISLEFVVKFVEAPVGNCPVLLRASHQDLVVHERRAPRAFKTQCGGSFQVDAHNTIVPVVYPVFIELVRGES